MVKRRNDTPPAGDYIDQLHWQSRHRRLWPVHYEPKWKYKIVYRYRHPTWLDRIAGMLLLISVMSAVFLSISSKSMAPGAKIFFGTVLGLAIMIILFALRDGSKNEEESSEDSDG